MGRWCDVVCVLQYVGGLAGVGFAANVECCYVRVPASFSLPPSFSLSI
jgi:hypothetical protein